MPFCRSSSHQVSTASDPSKRKHSVDALLGILGYSRALQKVVPLVASAQTLHVLIFSYIRGPGVHSAHVSCNDDTGQGMSAVRLADDSPDKVEGQAMLHSFPRLN